MLTSEQYAYYPLRQNGYGALVYPYHIREYITNLDRELTRKDVKLSSEEIIKIYHDLKILRSLSMV